MSTENDEARAESFRTDINSADYTLLIKEEIDNACIQTIRSGYAAALRQAISENVDYGFIKLPHTIDMSQIRIKRFLDDMKKSPFILGINIGDTRGDGSFYAHDTYTVGDIFAFEINWEHIKDLEDPSRVQKREIAEALNKLPLWKKHLIHWSPNHKARVLEAITAQIGVSSLRITDEVAAEKVTDFIEKIESTARSLNRVSSQISNFPTEKLSSAVQQAKEIIERNEVVSPAHKNAVRKLEGTLTEFEDSFSLEATNPDDIKNLKILFDNNVALLRTANDSVMKNAQDRTRFGVQLLIDRTTQRAL